jgi:tight adherence protein B
MIAALAVASAIAVSALARRPRPCRGAPGVEPAPISIDRIVAVARRRSRRAPEPRCVASWCDDIVRRVRSGSTLRQALVEVPTDPSTAHATSSLRLAVERGLSIPDAADRLDDAGPHVRLAVGVLVTTSRIGGPAAASIDRTAMVLRQRAADIDERSTMAAQARLSTHVMTAVPLLMLALLVATDDDVRSVAMSPTGAMCIAVGLLLNAAGWYWMRRIVRTPT